MNEDNQQNTLEKTEDDRCEEESSKTQIAESFEEVVDEGCKTEEMHTEETLNASEELKSKVEPSEIESDKVKEKKVNSREELNQEDIDAVQFLAAEFNKEISGGKNTDQKNPVVVETVDVNVIEVAASQSITDDAENAEQNEAVASLSKEIKDDDGEQSSQKQPESQSKKRKIKTEDREFKCGFCDKSFSMKIALEKHLVVHGAKLPWQCDHCPEGFMKSSDYKEHCNKVHDNFRPFPCHICGKRLSNLGILKNHQGIHSGERPFACQFSGCEKSFLTKTNLDDHERKHVNAREFECETCHKRFNLKGDLRQHEKVHKEDKPFRCDYCDMAFPRGPSLWRHRRTHTGEKPYQCDICEKRFSRMENCQEHRRIHTGERPLICSVCGKAFRDSGNFSNHKKIHQEGYVPRKKRTSTTVKKPKEANPTMAGEDSEGKLDQEKIEGLVGSEKTEGENPSNPNIPQDVAFIVAPMQTDQSQDNMSISAISTASASNESSYVQVGNFLLTLEMEAAFKQIMQQQGGNNEFVTLTMTDGKNLEFISDPSQAEALMQAAAAQSQNATEIHLQDVQDVIKNQAEAEGSQVEAGESEMQEAVENIQTGSNSEIPQTDIQSSQV